MTSGVTTALIDLDNTLHDYNRAAAIARGRVGEAIAEAAALPAEDVLDAYQRAVTETSNIALSGAEARRLRLVRLAELLQKNLPIDHLVGVLESALIEAVAPFPGALAALENIAENYRIVIMTEGYGDIQRAIAAKIGINTRRWPLFASYDSGHRKLDGSAYIAAIERHQLQPQTTAMVGDNWDWDVMASSACGLSQIWISHGQDLRGPPPPRFLGAAREFRNAKPLLDSASR